MLDKKCFYPRGKGVGGTSLINALVYSRGSATDFDSWGAANEGWSYKDVLPYFTISEHLVKTDPDAIVDKDYHGKKGPLNVEYRVPRHPLSNIWIQANEEKGFKTIDLNGENCTGAALAQLTIKNGRRQDAGTAFVKPVKDRKNLNISTESYVTKVIINDKTKIAEAVQFVSKNKKYIAYAKNEIVLSAGAIGTPQILMLSGVGPKNHLKDLNIPLVLDLNVGQILREHPAYWGLSFETNFTGDKQPLQNYIKDFLKGQGGLTVSHEFSAYGYYRLSPYLKPKDIDLELFLAPNDGFTRYYVNEKLSLTKQKTSLNLKKPAGFSVVIILQKPRSTGSVKLKNNDAFEFPFIDPQFLSDFENNDIDMLYQGIQQSLDIVLNTEAFKKIKPTLYRQKLPDCDSKPYLSKEYWYCAIRHFTWSVYHPMGTCPMGSDPEKGAVVDKECKVHGIKKLRVVDASIYPITVSGHPMAHCIMFGEKLADVIKQTYVQNYKIKTEL